MRAALELARSRNQHVGRNAGAPQHLVGEAASAALRRARADSWLAVTAVTRKAIRATQFWGSWMVKVPTGGRNQ